VARSELTLGFVGSGKVEKRNAYALLRDLIEAEGGNVKFIFPLTKAFWNPALEVVSQYAIDNAIPVEAVVDDTTAKTRELKTLLTGARRQHQSAAVAHKIATLLEEARNGKLIVLWDDEDEAALDTVRAADERGVALLELTRGLDRIELVAGDDEPASDEVEDENSEEEEAVISGDADEDAGQEPSEEENAEEMEEDGEQEDTDSTEEFPEADAEDDLDGDDAGEDEAADEFPEDEGEEFSLPEEDESDVAVLDMEADIVEEVRQVTGMSEFQRRLLVVLERTSEALVGAINAVMVEEGMKPAPKPQAATKAPQKATSSKPAAARPAKKVAAPVKKAAKTAPPAKKAAPAVKRTVPAKKPAAPEDNGKGSMTKAAAQKIIDAYRPRRGRPPAEVTEARKVLGLA